MQLFLRVSQYYILRGNVPFPRAGHIIMMYAVMFYVILNKRKLMFYVIP